MIDLFYVYCIDKKDLQEIAKTAVVGLQKLIRFFFVCFLLIRYEGNELTKCMVLNYREKLETASS